MVVQEDFKGLSNVRRWPSANFLTSDKCDIDGNFVLYFCWIIPEHLAKLRKFSALLRVFVNHPSWVAASIHPRSGSGKFVCFLQFNKVFTHLQTDRRTIMLNMKVVWLFQLQIMWLHHRVIICERTELNWTRTNPWTKEHCLKNEQRRNWDKT